MASTSSPHEYIPAKETDGRSPCPALNALANHGYLPRDGKNISLTQYLSAITSVYNISYPLAFGLTAGGIALCGHGLSLDLEGLRKHNAIEHDASMVHRDLDETGGEIPSNKPDPELLQTLIGLSDGHKVTLDNLIQLKYNREVRLGSKQLPKTLNLVSHGEPILCYHALSRDDTGMPVEWVKTWLGEERLPEGLAPPETLGAISIHKKAGALTAKIDALHAEAAKERRDV